MGNPRGNHMLKVGRVKHRKKTGDGKNHKTKGKRRKKPSKKKEKEESTQPQKLAVLARRVPNEADDPGPWGQNQKKLRLAAPFTLGGGCQGQALSLPSGWALVRNLRDNQVKGTRARWPGGPESKLRRLYHNCANI